MRTKTFLWLTSLVKDEANLCLSLKEAGYGSRVFIYKELCLYADLRWNALGVCNCISYINTVFHVNRFFVTGYHNNLRNIDLLENSAPRLLVSSECFQASAEYFCAHPGIGVAAGRAGESHDCVNQRLLETKEFLNWQRYLLTGGQCQALIFKVK